MKKLFLLPLLLSFALLSQNIYKYQTDLVNVNKNTLKVELAPPSFTEATVTFCFPSVVPGTYEQYNFGRFITNFKVIAKNNASIQVNKKDENCYEISPSSAIEKITYEVSDTWHTSIKNKVVFEPAGTSIDSGRVFVINNHGIYGYFRGMDRLPFEISYTKPKNFYPATALSTFTIGEQKDILNYQHYQQLVDFPVIYSVPDTTSLTIHGSNILFSCYSANQKITSRYLAAILQPILSAMTNFFGGNLPIDKYAFLFYFTDNPTLSGSSGALEHNQSSLYVLPEIDSTYIAQTIKDVAAHEFLHILTPLNIHSEQIEYFDFNNTKMSKHLWLYEGTTEYHAHFLQEKEGIITPDAFMNKMMEKISNAKTFDDTQSFTLMSSNVLQDAYHKNYNNVYEKGALIGMCLDLLLIKESNGKYNLQKLLIDLSKKYGKSKPFPDDSLFNIIEKMTYPSVGIFFKKYLIQSEPLPLKEYLADAGLEYIKEKTTTSLTLGGMDINVNDKNQFIITGLQNLDAFGKQFGFKVNDIIYAFNNRLFTLETAEEIASDYVKTAKEGDMISFEVTRVNKKGNSENIVLKGKVKKVKHTIYNEIQPLENMTDNQKMILRTWLGHNNERAED